MIRRFTKTFIAVTLLVSSLGLLAGSAWAVEAFPLDRQYLLGEDAGENGQVGNAVGLDIGGDFFTFDSVGVGTVQGPPLVPGSFQDLQRFGDPQYASVSDRPLFSSGVGVEFDGAGDYLRGANVNSPDTSRASLGYDDDPGTAPANTPGPNNYSGISNREIQFWVKPDATDAGNPSKTQSIVMDTNQHGVQIVNGNWSMRYAGVDFDSGVAVDTASNNGWSHVMIARPFGPSGAQGGSRLYINGVAVTAASGGYNGGANEELVLGSNTSRDGDNEFDGGTTDFFHGVIDNLEITLIGNNTADAGPPVGMIDNEFEFFNDNEFAADEVSGFDIADLNRDGSVSGNGTAGDDVALFVAGWLTRHEVNGVQVGDLNSLAAGDFNADGITNLLDWSILNAANPSAGAAAALAISGANVPEPTSLLLAGLAGIAIALVAKRR